MFNGRLSSYTSNFSPFRRTTSTTDIIPSDLTDALESSITSPPLDNKNSIDLANKSLLNSIELLQSISRIDSSQRLILLSQILFVLEEEIDCRKLFIDQGGYLSVILSGLSSLEEVVDNQGGNHERPEEREREKEEREVLKFEIVKLLFSILEVVIRGNEVNKKLFGEIVGFKALSEAIQLSNLMKGIDYSDHVEGVKKSTTSTAAAEKLLSILYSFLISDFHSTPIFTSLRLQLNSSIEPSKSNSTSVEEDTISTSRGSEILQLLSQTSKSVVITNPGVAILMLNLAQQLGSNQSELKLMVICSLYALSLASLSSQIALSRNEIVGMAIEKLYSKDTDLVEGEERLVWKELLSTLKEFGTGLVEAKSLFKSLILVNDEKEELNEEILELLLHSSSSKFNQRPSFIHFNPSSYIEIPSLGKTFPPTTFGYTFLSWISIVNVPTSKLEDERIIIFKCQDVEISIDSNLNLNFTTSSNVKPSIIFKRHTFKLNQVYHLAITHSKSKFTSNSPVSLYINGKLIETIKLTYPSIPSKDTKVTASLGSEESLSSKWNLGPTWFIHGEFSEKKIFFCFNLGPKYIANFQDSTTTTTTTTNLLAGRLEDKIEDQSLPILPLVPENRIYFNFSALNVIEFDSSVDDIKALNLPSNITNSTKKVILNSAIQNSNSFGYLNGNISIAKIKGMDSTIWQLGGISILLRMIELSITPAQLIKSIQLFVSILKTTTSSKLIEETKNSKSFETLIQILKLKLSIITGIEIQESLFELIGFKSPNSNQSLISNFDGCKYLLLDFTFWTKVDISLQLNHFDLLEKFIEEQNEFSEFNLKQLMRMHIVKKILFSLRTEMFINLVLKKVVNLLFLIISKHFTSENIRYLATFLTATLCSSSESKVTSDAVTDPTQFVLDASIENTTGFQIGLEVLKRLHDILLTPSPNGLKDLTRFSKNITTKWMLLFILDKETPPFASILALRILVRVLQTQGEIFVNKFINESFPLLTSSITRLWNYPQIQLTLFSLLYSFDITLLSLDTPFSISIFSNYYHQQDSISISIITQPVIRTILECLNEGLKVFERNEGTFNNQDVLTNGNLTLSEGFSIICQLITKASKIGGIGRLISSSASLHKLILTLAPLLPRPSLEDPSFIEISSLPVFTSRNNYEVFPSSNKSNSEVEEQKDIEEISIIDVELELPRSSNDSVLIDSDQTSLKSITTTFTSEIQSNIITTPANALIHLLSQQILNCLTFRHRKVKQIDGEINLELSLSLRVLENIFDSTASLSRIDQISFRSLILSQVMKGIDKSLWTTSFSNRIALFIHLVTDMTLEGWNYDCFNVLEFLLSYLERVLQEIPLGTTNSGNSFSTSTINSLFQSLNRLILFSLSQETSKCISIIKLLIQFQLGVFSTSNNDIDFFKSLIQRLDNFILRVEVDTEIEVVVDFFKLLILQRPVELEIAFQNLELNTTRFSSKLINANNIEFVQLINDCRDQIDSLKLSWNEFLDYETKRAKKQVLREISRLDEISQRFIKSQTSRTRKIKLYTANILEWREGVQDVESIRLFNTRQDISDHKIFISQEWNKQLSDLYLPTSIFGTTEYKKWEIDLVEGPLRIRAKLIPVIEAPKSILSLTTSSQSLNSNLKAVNEVLQTIETKDIKKSDTLEEVETESETPIELEQQEDKNRKVRRSLESGDIIQAVFNSSRVIGLDSRVSLMLFTENNLYLISDFFQRPNGELVEACEAPLEERDQNLLILSSLAENSDIPIDRQTHKSRHWNWKDLVEVYERTYLFQPTALELFFADGQSTLLVFSKSDRKKVYSLLQKYNPDAVDRGSLHVTGSTLGSKLQDHVIGQRTKLELYTSKWQRREISNFEYLMFLNTNSGRTFNDLTNYPVFPWILADYYSKELDLKRDSTFRNLALPIGAQTEERRNQSKDRYESLQELEDGTKPFHYGTHYSSSATVVGFMVRCEPFTQSYLAIQKSFDHPDRMFWSIAKAYESASRSRTDVRELIPAFFYLPDFLRNHNDLEFGLRQESGSSIDNVDLPPWAKNSPRLFVEKHREALESDYVSLSLNHFIDLIFGYKQRGKNAIDSFNVYHSLAYDGIDLDLIKDEDERKAAILTIHNFGQCPKRLFSKPHPKRTLSSKTSIFSQDLLIEQQFKLLVQSSTTITSISDQVLKIYASSAPEKTTATSTLLVPGGLLEISWSSVDGSLRVFNNDVNHKVQVASFENMHQGIITCASFADKKTFITGSNDSTIAIWNWDLNLKGKQVSPIAYLRGHSHSISKIVSSRNFSIIVSASGNEAIIWDLNRHGFVHKLSGHESKITLLAISESTGDIATVCGSILRVWSVNGELLVCQSTSSYLDPITSVTFSLSERKPIIATGHTNGIVKLWNRIPAVVKADEPFAWELEMIHQLSHVDKNDVSSFSTRESITALAFTPRTLYTGDSNGKVFLFAPSRKTL